MIISSITTLLLFAEVSLWHQTSTTSDCNLSRYELKISDEGNGSALISASHTKRIVLHNNVVNGEKKLNQAMINEPNTIYVIENDLELAEDVTIPPNCTLEFNGGSISGSCSLSGDDTVIIAEPVRIFGNNLTISGVWNINESYAEWWGAAGDGLTEDTQALHNAMKMAKVVSLKENAKYLICPNCDVNIIKALYIMEHDLYIKGNHATLKMVDDLTNRGGSYTVIYGPDYPDYSFKCEDLTVDWNDDGNSDWNYNDVRRTDGNDQRMFYHGDRNYQVEIRNCHFIYYGISAVYAVMTRESAIIDNCIFEYKHENQYFDNSALRVAPNWNATAKVTRCSFHPYGYTPELSEHRNMIGGIELHGLGTAYIEDNIFEHVTMSINVADGHCTRWNPPTQLSDNEKMVGTKSVKNNLFVDCSNAVVLWSNAHCLNNIEVEGNEVRTNKVNGGFRYPGLVRTADTDMAWLDRSWGKVGKICNVKIKGNTVRYDIDWTKIWNSENYLTKWSNPVIHIHSKQLSNIEISDNILINIPFICLSIGNNINYGTSVDCRYDNIQISNNQVLDNIALNIVESWQGQKASMFKSISFEYVNNQLIEFDVHLKDNIIKHSSVGYPMIAFSNKFGNIDRDGIRFEGDNDIDHVPYFVINSRSRKASYQKYQEGKYNPDEKFRLAYTKGKGDVSNKYSSVPYFIDVRKNLIVPINPQNPYTTVYSENNKNLQRGEYMTPKGNYVFVINSNENGTFMEFSRLIAGSEDVTALIKLAPLYTETQQ